MSITPNSFYALAAASLADEVAMLSDADAYALHGIEYYADDSVYDTIEMCSYATLTDWAVAQASATHSTSFLKRRPTRSGDY